MNKACNRGVHWKYIYVYFDENTNLWVTTLKTLTKIWRYEILKKIHVQHFMSEKAICLCVNTDDLQTASSSNGVFGQDSSQTSGRIYMVCLHSPQTHPVTKLERIKQLESNVLMLSI
jgi:hypothetical protein